MEMHKIVKAHGKEVALGVVVLGAAGTTLGLVLRKHAHRFEINEGGRANPGLLNSDKLSDERKLQVNRVAAYILAGDNVTRTELQERLGYTRAVVKVAKGFLEAHGLVETVKKEGGIPTHYEPTEALRMAALDTARDERAYPLLAAAAEEFKLPPDTPIGSW